MTDKVNVTEIADAVAVHISNGGKWSDICHRLKWFDNRGKADTSRLQRSLGLRDTKTGGNSHPQQYSYRSRRIDHDTAIRIVEALGREPEEFGL